MESASFLLQRFRALYAVFCTSTNIVRVYECGYSSTGQEKGRERKGERARRNELPPNQKYPFQIRKTALDTPATMLIDGCKGGISITIKPVYEPINVVSRPGFISINRD